MQNKSDSVAQDVGKASSASSILHSASVHTSISAMSVSSDANYRATTSWMQPTPSFPAHHITPGAPGTPGPPGLASASSTSSNLAAPLINTDSSSSSVPRQNMPAAAIASNPVGSHMGSTYPSIPSMAASQGLWLQPPQMGVPRPPFLPYAAAYPVPFPFPAHGVTLPAVQVPDSQPPGVTPVGATGATSASLAHQPRGTADLQTEVVEGHSGMLSTILMLH